MVKSQFIQIARQANKQPSTEQPGAAAPQEYEPIQPTPASQGSANPSLPQPAGTPHAPTESPYLQVSHSLPGIPVPPNTQRSGTLNNSSLLQGHLGSSRGMADGPNKPKHMGQFVPPGSLPGVNLFGNVASPANSPSNNGNSPHLSSSPQGHFPGPHTPQSGTGNPLPGSVPNNSYPGYSQRLGGTSFGSMSNITPGSGSLAPPLQHSMTGRRETEKLRRLSTPPPNVGNAKGTIPAQHVLSSSGFALGIQGILNSSQDPKVAFPRTGPLAPPVPQPLTKKHKRSFPIWARIVMGLLVFLVISTGGAFAYYQTQIAPALNNIIGKQAIHHPSTQTSGKQTNTQNDPGTIPTGRTNILLLGSDTDGKGNDVNIGAPLAQTIMIITVDPQKNFVGMLSIPRDMQVTENGYTAPKLDEVFANAYAGGNLQDKVASGAGAMEDIIQYNFGIHIDHYAWVGLGGFVKVINTAGGIDVDTIHPMVDDTYPDDVGNTNGSIYDYKRVSIAPGPQHMNGLQALEYVRTRHSDLIGDFGRTVRQQQIIAQLKTKLATPDTTGKASALLQDLNGAVQTDMELNDIIGLGNLARGIDTNSVQHLTLGPPDYAAPNINGDRPSNYLPLCRNIVPAIQKMFNIPSPNCVSQVGSTTPQPPTVTPTPTPPPDGTPTPTPKPTRTPKANQGSTLTNTTQNNIFASNPLNSGVQSLLDVLFVTTFESFDAMQI